MRKIWVAQRLLQKQKLPTDNFTIKSMKDLIQEILKRWADDEVNLQSQAAQDALAKEIMHTVLKFINNHNGMDLKYK